MSTSMHNDLLLFTPAPMQRATANGWSAEVQRAFVAALAKGGVVAAAARSVGRSVRSAWALRKRAGAEGFAAAWDTALQIARDRAMEVVVARLDDPVMLPVFYRGRQIGVRPRHDNRLLFAALRAHDAILRGERVPLGVRMAVNRRASADTAASPTSEDADSVGAALEGLSLEAILDLIDPAGAGTPDKGKASRKNIARSRNAIAQSACKA